MMINDLKVMLNLTGEDPERDKRLELIINSVNARLKVLLGSSDVPGELEYIVREVSIARYNKIGSEGMSKHNVEGEDLTFSSNDFEPFMDDINAYLSRTDNAVQKGGFKFI